MKYGCILLRDILSHHTDQLLKQLREFLCGSDWCSVLFMHFVSPDSDVVLTHNQSGRFESRFVSVGIQASPSIWLKGMEGSALGVWVAHGEGTVRKHTEAVS